MSGVSKSPRRDWFADPMELVVRLCWLSLALIHAPPALTAASPRVIGRLYDVTPDGDVALLLAHRGVLFACVAVAALTAAFHAPSRRLAVSVVGLSVGGFLALYWRAGMPEALRDVALADGTMLVPLLIVAFAAFCRRTS